VETFAEQAAVALEYARLQGKLQRLAVLEDRERIAKELHDGAIQALFAVGMGLQARPCWPATPSSAAASRTPSRSWTGSSATCATTSSACAQGSWPTASSTRPSTAWSRSSSSAPGCWPSPRSTLRRPPSWPAGPATWSSWPARPGGPIPFLIDWGDGVHPSTSAPTGLTLVSFHLEHPRPEVLTGVLDALAVQAAAVRGPAPGWSRGSTALVVRRTCGNRLVEPQAARLTAGGRGGLRPCIGVFGQHLELAAR
jgi:Histidine kinase